MKVVFNDLRIMQVLTVQLLYMLSKEKTAKEKVSIIHGAYSVD